MMTRTFVLIIALAMISGCSNDPEEEARSLAIKASHLVNQGQYAEAIPLFREATGLRPECAEYHVGFAMACVKTQNYNVARKEYHKALRILQEESKQDPERVDDFVMVLLCLDRDQEAKSALNRAKNRFEGNETISRLSEDYVQFKKDIAEYQIQE